MKLQEIALLVLGSCLAALSHAQSHEVVGASAPPVPVMGPGSPGDESALFSDSELDQMLAPIALYPDSVLTHILIASTYPLEIVEADRWRTENAHLGPEQALQISESQPWDPSVKALVAFPELLARMSRDLRWTQGLGDAFLLSEVAVMDRVQVLRDLAYTAGELRSTPEVEVVVEKQIIERVERRTIIIEPVVERVVYLPHYDTRRVYGSWHWASYPPLYWEPFHSHVRRHHRAVYWGPAVRVAPTFYIGALHWSNRELVVINHIDDGPERIYYRSRSLAHHHSAVHWRHKPKHRRGVAYHPAYVSRHAHRPEFREYRSLQPVYSHSRAWPGNEAARESGHVTQQRRRDLGVMAPTARIPATRRATGTREQHLPGGPRAGTAARPLEHSRQSGRQSAAQQQAARQQLRSDPQREMQRYEPEVRAGSRSRAQAQAHAAPTQTRRDSGHGGQTRRHDNRRER